MATRHEDTTAELELLAHRREHAEAERFKLMDAYHADAIDVTMLRREQDRIGAESRAIESRQAVLDASLDDWQESWTSPCGSPRASPRCRGIVDRTWRLLSAAVLDKVHVRNGHVVEAAYQEPFGLFFPEPRFEHDDVEVLGRYSNHADQRERIQRLRDIVLEAPRKPKLRTTKQVHRRLLPSQMDELVEAYQSGSTLNDIAQRFHVHRDNVSRALQSEGVPRRYHMMQGERLNKAIIEYQAGKSLAAVGEELGVSMDTVRVALKRAGVPLRPRPGWNYP